MPPKTKLAGEDYEALREMMVEVFGTCTSEFVSKINQKLDAIYLHAQKLGQLEKLLGMFIPPNNGISENPVDAVIVGDSITSALNKTGLSQLSSKSTTIKSIGGVVPSELTVPNVASTSKDIVIHVGAGCLSNNNDEVECFTAPEIAHEITTKLDSVATEHSNAKVHFSSIIHRTDLCDENESCEPVNVIIDETNNIVKAHCEANDMSYIDNNNIERQELYDGVHLNVPGALKLARNVAASIRGPKATRSAALGPKTPNPFHQVRVPLIGDRPDMRRSRYNNPRFNSNNGNSENNGTQQMNRRRDHNNYPSYQNDYYRNPHFSQYNDPMTYSNAVQRPRNNNRQEWPRANDNGSNRRPQNYGRAQNNGRPQNPGVQPTTGGRNSPQKSEQVTAAINNLLNAFSGQ